MSILCALSLAKRERVQGTNASPRFPQAVTMRPTGIDYHLGNLVFFS